MIDWFRRWRANARFLRTIGRQRDRYLENEILVADDCRRLGYTWQLNEWIEAEGRWAPLAHGSRPPVLRLVPREDPSRND